MKQYNFDREVIGGFSPLFLKECCKSTLSFGLSLPPLCDFRRRISKLWTAYEQIVSLDRIEGGDGMMRKPLRMWAKSEGRKEGRHKTSFFSPSCFLGPEWMSYVLTGVFLEDTRRVHNPGELIYGALGRMSDRQRCKSLQQNVM